MSPNFWVILFPLPVLKGVPQGSLHRLLPTICVKTCEKHPFFLIGVETEVVRCYKYLGLTLIRIHLKSQTDKLASKLKR